MPAQVRARAAPPRTLRVATPTTAPRSSKGIPAGRRAATATRPVGAAGRGALARDAYAQPVPACARGRVATQRRSRPDEQHNGRSRGADPVAWPGEGAQPAAARRRRRESGCEGAVRPVRAVGGAAGFVVGGAYSKGRRLPVALLAACGSSEKREQRRRGSAAVLCSPRKRTTRSRSPRHRSNGRCEWQRALSGRASPTYAAVTAQEEWAARRRRVQEASVHSDLPNWSLYAMVVKCDDDVRQEMFCMHLVTQVQQIFAAAGLERLAGGLRPYSIQSTSSRSGIIEAMTDATSVGRSCAAPAPPLRRR